MQQPQQPQPQHNEDDFKARQKAAQDRLRSFEEAQKEKKKDLERQQLAAYYESIERKRELTKSELEKYNSISNNNGNNNNNNGNNDNENDSNSQSNVTDKKAEDQSTLEEEEISNQSKMDDDHHSSSSTSSKSSIKNRITETRAELEHRLAQEDAARWAKLRQVEEQSALKRMERERAREMHREQQRLEQQRMADEQIRKTQEQMAVLQQIALEQQERLKGLTQSQMQSATAENDDPVVKAVNSNKKQRSQSEFIRTKPSHRSWDNEDMEDGKIYASGQYQTGDFSGYTSDDVKDVSFDDDDMSSSAKKTSKNSKQKHAPSEYIKTHPSSGAYPWWDDDNDGKVYASGKYGNIKPNDISANTVESVSSDEDDENDNWKADGSKRSQGRKSAKPSSSSDKKRRPLRRQRSSSLSAIDRGNIRKNKKKEGEQPMFDWSQKDQDSDSVRSERPAFDWSQHDHDDSLSVKSDRKTKDKKRQPVRRQRSNSLSAMDRSKIRSSGSKQKEENDKPVKTKNSSSSKDVDVSKKPSGGTKVSERKRQPIRRQRSSSLSAIDRANLRKGKKKDDSDEKAEEQKPAFDWGQHRRNSTNMVTPDRGRTKDRTETGSSDSKKTPKRPPRRQRSSSLSDMRTPRRERSQSVSPSRRTTRGRSRSTSRSRKTKSKNDSTPTRSLLDNVGGKTNDKKTPKRRVTRQRSSSLSNIQTSRRGRSRSRSRRNNRSSSASPKQRERSSSRSRKGKDVKTKSLLDNASLKSSDSTAKRASKRDKDSLKLKSEDKPQQDSKVAKSVTKAKSTPGNSTTPETNGQASGSEKESKAPMVDEQQSTKPAPTRRRPTRQRSSSLSRLETPSRRAMQRRPSRSTKDTADSSTISTDTTTTPTETHNTFFDWIKNSKDAIQRLASKKHAIADKREKKKEALKKQHKAEEETIKLEKQKKDADKRKERRFSLGSSGSKGSKGSKGGVKKPSTEDKKENVVMPKDPNSATKNKDEKSTSKEGAAKKSKAPSKKNDDMDTSKRGRNRSDKRDSERSLKKTPIKKDHDMDTSKRGRNKTDKRDSERSLKKTTPKRGVARQRSHSLSDMKTSRSNRGGKKKSQKSKPYSTGLPTNTSDFSGTYYDDGPLRNLDTYEDELTLEQLRKKVEELRKQLKETKEAEAREMEEEKEMAQGMRDHLEQKIRYSNTKLPDDLTLVDNMVQHNNEIISYLRMENQRRREENEEIKRSLFGLHHETTRLEKTTEETLGYLEKLEDVYYQGELDKRKVLLKGLQTCQESEDRFSDELERRSDYIEVEKNVHELCEMYMIQLLDMFHDNCDDEPLVTLLEEIRMGKHDDSLVERTTGDGEQIYKLQ